METVKEMSHKCICMFIEPFLPAQTTINPSNTTNQKAGIRYTQHALVWTLHTKHHFHGANYRVWTYWLSSDLHTKHIKLKEISLTSFTLFPRTPSFVHLYTQQKRKNSLSKQINREEKEDNANQLAMFNNNCWILCHRPGYVCAFYAQLEQFCLINLQFDDEADDRMLAFAVLVIRPFARNKWLDIEQC